MEKGIGELLQNKKKLRVLKNHDIDFAKIIEQLTTEALKAEEHISIEDFENVDDYIYKIFEFRISAIEKEFKKYEDDQDDNGVSVLDNIIAVIYEKDLEWLIDTQEGFKFYGEAIKGILNYVLEGITTIMNEVKKKKLQNVYSEIKTLNQIIENNFN